MGRGHKIMLVICKVLVFRKFYFYEPFYFVKIILRGFVFAETGGWILEQMEGQTFQWHEMGYFLFFGN